MSEIALSHSRLSDFNQCPHKFKSKYIDKTYPDDSNNPAFVKGNRIHKACEEIMLKVRAGQEYTHPDLSLKAVRNAVPLINAIAGSYPDVRVEQQVAMNTNFMPTTWFAKNGVMYRAIFDVYAKKDNKVLMVDWKSGKFAPYSGYGGQLHLSSMIIMSLDESVDEVQCVYAFLDHQKKDDLIIKRSELAQLQGHFQDEYEKVNRETAWEPQVNNYCHWCAAPGCKYSKEG